MLRRKIILKTFVVKKTDLNYLNEMHTSNEPREEVLMHGQMFNSWKYRHSKTVKCIEVGKVVDRNTNYQGPPALI